MSATARRLLAEDERTIDVAGRWRDKATGDLFDVTHEDYYGVHGTRHWTKPKGYLGGGHSEPWSCINADRLVDLYEFVGPVPGEATT